MPTRLRSACSTARPTRATRCTPDKFPKKIRSCYDGWGNSYLTVWSVETLRIQHVTGDSNYDLRSSRRPMKSSEMSRSPSNKLVTGDWPWWADRKKNSPSEPVAQLPRPVSIQRAARRRSHRVFRVSQGGVQLELHRPETGSQLQMVVTLAKQSQISSRIGLWPSVM